MTLANGRRALLGLFLAALIFSPRVLAAQEVTKWPSNAEMQVSLDSMMALALSAPDVDERGHAITGILSVGGITGDLPNRRYTGVVERLRRIYEQEPTYELRSHIVLRLDLLLDERAEALEFLRMVASERRAEEDAVDFPVPLIAVAKLARMGGDGRAILEQLNAGGDVKNPVARAQLQRMKREGWEPRR